MKQPREKTRIFEEIKNIRRLLFESPVLIAEKEGDNGVKEPYEKPKMVTKTLDEDTEVDIPG